VVRFDEDVESLGSESARMTCIRTDTQALGSAATRQALLCEAMIFTAAQIGLLATELEARGFLAGVGKFILIVIIVLVVGGALLGFAVGRRR
jgi:hypothetical protein